MDEGLLLIRVVLGLLLAAHGAQKLFKVFGGLGVDGTGTIFETMGFRPGRAVAIVAGLAEAGGGVAFALGLLTPFTAAVIVAPMLVAMGVHRPNGFFAQNGGYEFPLLIAAIAVSVATTGPGALSLDTALGLGLTGPVWGVIALALGVGGALPPLLARNSALRRGATEERQSA